MKVRQGVAGVATVVLGALAIAVLVQAHRHPDQTLAGSAAELALQLAVGLGLWAAGLTVIVLRSTRLPGSLLAGAGVAVFLAEVPLPESGGAFLFTVALVGGATASALAGSGALFYSPPARWLPDGIVAGAAVASTLLWLGVLPAATFDPSATGCFICPRNLFLVRGDSGLHDDLVTSGSYAAAATCAALALLVLVRWVQVRAAERWIMAPVVVGGAAAACLAAAGFAHQTRLDLLARDSTAHRLWLAQCFALGVVAAGVGLETARTRMLSHLVAGVLVETPPSAEQLRATLAAAVGDDDLTVVFPRPDLGPVDSEGRPAALDGAGASLEVKREDEVIARVRYRGNVDDPPSERLVEAARAAGLALEHASSRARLRAELAELTDSRARIVEVGDRERRRLERNLHDGAQQRLIALSLALQRNGAASIRARNEILAALDELRSLAHGIHPTALTDAGLEAALSELADGARAPIRVTVDINSRPPPAVESAAYRLVLDAVGSAERAGDGSPVSVAIAREADDLRVRIELPGVDRGAIDLEHALDRVAALEGDVTVTASDPAVVTARLRCGS